eukprot:TRINITY_DN28509_c0_g1_i1.p1 TRINITY_DN28509_c0_g1~~TRINITY_DN28509_c0_g1_i1.p1  ORF type:complete len:1435 (+),score=246.83 TRINITY_DN28509_c0_g1_i1:25-4305(+)
MALLGGTRGALVPHTQRGTTSFGDRASGTKSIGSANRFVPSASLFDDDVPPSTPSRSTPIMPRMPAMPSASKKPRKTNVSVDDDFALGAACGSRNLASKDRKRDGAVDAGGTDGFANKEPKDDASSKGNNPRDMDTSGKAVFLQSCTSNIGSLTDDGKVAEPACTPSVSSSALSRAVLTHHSACPPGQEVIVHRITQESSSASQAAKPEQTLAPAAGDAAQVLREQTPSAATINSTEARRLTTAGQHDGIHVEGPHQSKPQASHALLMDDGEQDVFGFGGGIDAADEPPASHRSMSQASHALLMDDEHDVFGFGGGIDAADEPPAKQATGRTACSKAPAKVLEVPSAKIDDVAADTTSAKHATASVSPLTMCSVPRNKISDSLPDVLKPRSARTVRGGAGASHTPASSAKKQAPKRRQRAKADSVQEEHLQGSPGTAVASAAKSSTSNAAGASTKKRKVQKNAEESPAANAIPSATRRKAKKATEEPVPSTAVPYGANFVRQDLRKFKKTGSSKGGSANSRRFSKFHDKNGRLKSKYSRPPEEVTAAPMTRRQEKEQRLNYLRQSRQAQTCLLKVSRNLNQASVFSPAVTPDLLAAIREDQDQQTLGEISDVRPPDRVDHVTAEPSAAGPRESSFNLPTEKKPEDYTPQDLTAVLQSVFGHEKFRAGQQEAISSVLACQHTLLLLSTGCGKSLCYQLPAYLLREEGLTLVVSPLVSLMADQLMRLPTCLRGAVISSQQSREQSRDVMRAVRARLVDVLFVAPERLSMWSFDGCGLPPIALACVDEAHCVSEWSHNFRPDYLRLHEFLVGSLGAQRLLALTATATRPTIKSVCDILHLSTVVRSDKSFTVQALLEESAQPRVQRSNLTMDVRRVADEDTQVRELIKILRMEEHSRVPVIVYVWKRVTADQLAKQLRSHVNGGVRAYHGNMVPDARRAVQDAFMSGTVRIIVATVAFGMGLDKSNIRLVVHFGLPRSIENYIQETGRCSRDGAPGNCVALVSPRDYKTMRWLASGGAGGGTQASVVRRLLCMLLTKGQPGAYQRYELGDEAVAAARARIDIDTNGTTPPLDIAATPDSSWKAYCIAFDEKEVSREMNCSTDELHSVLAHLSRHARGFALLTSNFPTKLKLRFFRTDPDELAKVDPLLRQVMPLAKKVGPVYSIETAKALAKMGGQAGQLSNGLWQARGDEFSVEKADYGYMLSVLNPVSEAQLQDWASQISNINIRAQETSVEKLDAAFIALSRAAEAIGGETKDDAGSVDSTLTGLIDAYFAATDDPSHVVAGDGDIRRRLLSSALGEEYRNSVSLRNAQHFVQKTFAPTTNPQQSQTERSDATSSHEQLDSGSVNAAVTRLVMSPDWPDLPSDDPDAVAHAVAQFLAGIGSAVLPVRRWREHRFWGCFKNIGDFQLLEELVRGAMVKIRGLNRPRA